MLCCVCKEREATLHLTQIVGEKMQKVDLCEECAKTKGVDPSQFSMADLMMGLGASQEIDQAGSGDLRCSHCGFTQGDFKKTGRLGCPDCYDTFAEAIGGLLKTMHKGVRHVGKAPEKLRQTRDLSEHLELLKKRLGKAIDTEDFEQAAVLRDEIKKTNLLLKGNP